MKLISNLLSDSTITAFGWTLVHSLWQTTVLCLLAAAVFYLLRKSASNIRYATGIGFLSLQALTSAATFIYYQFKATPAVGNAGKSLKNVSLQAVTPILNVVKNPLPMTLKIQFWLSAHLHELVVCWLIGAGFLLLRFLGGWIFTERLRLNAKIVMDREWRARFGVIIAKMNISKSIEFKESAKILTPMVIGAFSPVVLIPIGLLSGFSTAQVEAILAHELAHIRRNDYLVNMLQSFMEVVFFFHPAIWWLSDRVRAEREHCCDDIALTVCGDKMSLAHALVKVAEWQTAPRMAMAFASKKPLLLRRVQRVLGLSPKSARTFGNLPMMMLALSLVIGVSVYAVAQKVDKTKSKKPVHKTVKIKHDDPDKLLEIDMEVPELAEVAPDIEAMEVPEIDFEALADIQFAGNFMNDSIQKKMAEAQKRMAALQVEMEPLNHRMEEINLEMEKQRFEVERFQRELEKIEFKKESALEMREDLMEKRSTLLEQSRSGQNKKNETDLDNQLAEFEQQIKVQEQTISQLNSQISATRKEALKAEEPIRKMDGEIQEINEKIEEINGKIGVETLSFERAEHPRTARLARVMNKNVNVNRVPPPPPPARVKAANPAKPAKAPKPPLPPAKK
ncbi:M56 family metallopeptidase [Dyadobacter luticola]|uniref:Peptidase M56 domain-containing protein n=1 Tax=Dyadobacter luticola TaxID=1979387 RepID=A0A5R9KP22_9BACT|nr:M56 family metallopeptidase [Dyadobacter luticola]TLU97878.1 hypothetical protein FEN17_24085 [Dyadobacter luticola]